MKKISTLLLSLMLLCLFNIVNAQPNWYVQHFDAGTPWSGQPTGGYVIFDFTNFECKATTTVVGGIPATYSMIQVWWGGSTWGIKIQEAPHLKFRAKRTTAKAQNFSISYAFTDGTTQGVSHTIPGGLTTVYQDFYFDLSTDITTLQLGGKVVKNCYEFQWTLTPSTDDGIYIDDFLIGDSANPCPAKRPTLDALPLTLSRNFNETIATNINLSGISDGNSGTKGTIVVTAISSDPTIVPNPTVIYNSPDATGTVQCIGAQPPKNGSATISVTVTDTAYCNSSLTKSVPVTVKVESLWFVLSSTAVSVNPADGEKSISIDGISNVGKTVTPDNYHGLTMAATAVSNGGLLTAMTDAPEIDTLTGSAVFNYTIDPTAPDKSVIKINFALTSMASGTAKTTSPGVTGQPSAVLTITVKKTGLASETAEELNVYPNPASDVINVVLPAGAEKIDVVNAAGVIAKSVNVKGQSGTVAVSTAGLSAGNYIISAGNAKASVVVK